MILTAPLEVVTRFAGTADFPAAAVEAARVMVVHDLAVGASACALMEDLLAPPVTVERGVVDFATGTRVSMFDAVGRNGQLFHALTQDDTLQHVMTHVGATSLPVLLAIGEEEDVSVADFLAGFTASFASTRRRRCRGAG